MDMLGLPTMLTILCTYDYGKSWEKTVTGGWFGAVAVETDIGNKLFSLFWNDQITEYIRIFC